MYSLTSPNFRLHPQSWTPTYFKPGETNPENLCSAAVQTSTQSAVSRKQTSNASSSGPPPHTTYPSSNLLSMPRPQPNWSRSPPTTHSPTKQASLFVRQRISRQNSLIDGSDMGMTYAELSVFGRLRKEDKLGPYGAWSKLLHVWGDRMSPQQVYEKVRWFFWCYSIST